MRCFLNLTKQRTWQQEEGLGDGCWTCLQEDFAVILLAPCFEYTFSPLEIQFDDNLTSLGRLDVLQNMNQVTVERHQSN